MRLNFRVRLTSPLLGHIMTNTGQTVFEVEDQALVLDLEEIAWRLENAAASMKLEDVVNASSLRFPEKITCPLRGTYIKQWRRKGTGERKRREFECIREGAMISIPLRLVSEINPPDVLRVPTLTEVRGVLEEMGSWYGLQGWGSELGFGRFRVEELSEDNFQAEANDKHPTSGPSVERNGSDRCAGSGIPAQEADLHVQGTGG